MPKVNEIFPVGSGTTAQSTSKAYAVPLLMGIEVELEGWDGHSISDEAHSRWNVIADHSLRNNGVEFVLRQPKQGKALEDAISILGRTIEGRSLSLSHRCSVHCHIDFREATTETVEKFFLLYMLLEPSLYTISSKDRYSNIYCPGLTHTTQLLQNAAIHLPEGRLEHLLNFWAKYTGINLCPLSNLGSIEIRTHRGTANVEDILQWTRILNYMYAAAVNLTKEEINSFQTPDQLVETVFPDDLQDSIMCDNLLLFWNSVTLNRTFYNLVGQVIGKQTKQPEAGNSVQDAIVAAVSSI